MSIEPIRRSVEVRAAPARAFALFVERIGTWWPRDYKIGQAPLASVVIEPREGGGWFEVDDDGTRTDWGRVLEWAPPERLLLAWQIGADWRFDPELLTEVEIGFEPLAAGGTRVTLEHRKLEALGADAERVAAMLRGGWQLPLDAYAGLANQ